MLTIYPTCGYQLWVVIKTTIQVAEVSFLCKRCLKASVEKGEGGERELWVTLWPKVLPK